MKHALVLVMLVMAGCVAKDTDSSGPPPPEPTPTGLFRVGLDGLETVEGFNGVTIDNGTIHFDWLHVYPEDTVRLFWLDEADEVTVEHMHDIEIEQFYTDESGEGRFSSAICIAWVGQDSTRGALQLALGEPGDGAAFTPFSTGWGGYAHTKSWATVRGSGPLLLNGLLIGGGVSGIQTVQWDDEDAFESRVTVHGDFRLIELPEVPIYCGPDVARFEEGPVKLPGRVVQGGSVSFESPYGAYGCVTQMGFGQGRGSGSMEINGDEVQFDGTETLELSGDAIADARISIDFWEGDLQWGIFGWPNVLMCD